jgi:hypothetical protein
LSIDDSLLEWFISLVLKILPFFGYQILNQFAYRRPAAALQGSVEGYAPQKIPGIALEMNSRGEALCLLLPGWLSGFTLVRFGFCHSRPYLC